MTIDITPIGIDPNWWRQALVYQIYPRSFADANGDGVGDLVGITEKLPYLKELGVDAIWLSPFYPSALKDGGYDVADYRDVDPRIGTIAQFDTMTAAAKEAGIKIIVDIVPNHSSDDHVWFQAALKAGKGSPERERYIFRDGLGPNKDQPPTDWETFFGGSAWDPVGDGQWYLHLFDTSQPDFNWDHPEVREDFLKTLRFWGDHGVAGFRIDVANACTKDLSGDLPNWKEVTALSEQMVAGTLPEDTHPFLDRNSVFDVYREWRKVFNEYNPPLTAVAEAWVAPHRKHLYAAKDGLGQAFSFDMLMSDYDPVSFKKIITESLEHATASGSSTTWVFSNHDVIRHATRHALDIKPDNYREATRKYLLARGQDPKVDVELGLRRANAATQLILALPGSTYIYQGEELGLPEDVSIPDEERQDPTFFRSPGRDVGRDGCRICIPWVADAPNMGFGPGAAPHLKQPEVYKQYAVDVEDKDPKSTLNFYRKAINLRRELQGAEELVWKSDTPDVIHFERPGGWQSITNFGKEAIALPEGKVVVTSGELVDGKLPQDTTAWVVPA
ncbi:Oligo-1,6-glucosidase [Vanrija pseudolonga]|uniref:Oligo-1,6-glucosidase n=1 Tax=Vanrija pseudolonga TaxID=143232 RepID=A0AAF0YBL2_9TREE|nr:Oligo-1,6-glucosidase [Vanrija pseudolonga]